MYAHFVRYAGDACHSQDTYKLRACLHTVPSAYMLQVMFKTKGVLQHVPGLYGIDGTSMKDHLWALCNCDVCCCDPGIVLCKYYLLLDVWSYFSQPFPCTTTHHISSKRGQHEHLAFLFCTSDHVQELLLSKAGFVQCFTTCAIVSARL